MKETIKETVDQASALLETLERVRKLLGRYDGEQLNEARTERQLDRWTQERGTGEAMDSAVKHMTKVLQEIRWVQGQLDA